MSMYGKSVLDSRITTGAGMAKQSAKDECDVNLIVAQYVKTGFLGHVSAGIPSFVDVSELTDYRSAIEQVRSAEKYFAGLPADVRFRFGNDAIAFMEYLESGASEDDLRALGLEVLGDRRARSQDARESDVETPPALEEAPAASDTLVT